MRVNTGSVNVKIGGNLLPVNDEFFTCTSTTFVDFSCTFLCTGSNPNLQFGQMGSGEWVEVRAISVRELPGNHARQDTSNSRPTLRQPSSIYYIQDDLSNDALNWAAPAGTYTIAFVSSAGAVTILTGQALSGATDILLTQNLVGYIAVDRALTADETTGVTNYLESLAA